MNSQEFEKHFKKVVERSGAVLLRKREEYANDSSVFRNFESAVGLSTKNSNVGVAWEYTVKHLQSLKDIINMVEEGKYYGRISHELINEKLGDIINYMILIEGMLHQHADELPF